MKAPDATTLRYCAADLWNQIDQSVIDLIRTAESSETAMLGLVVRMLGSIAVSVGAIADELGEIREELEMHRLGGRP